MRIQHAVYGVVRHAVNGASHMGFWEQIILMSVMGVLSGFKKSPQDVHKFKTILVHILNDICELLGVAPPVVP